MKINLDQYPGISSYFALRANPAAPEYEPHLWNDCSHNEYELLLERYKPILEKLSQKLYASPPDRINRPSAIAQTLSTYKDQSLSLVGEVPEAIIKVMRSHFMRFLNTTAMSANCYAYALNIRHGFKGGDLLTPGHANDVGGICSESLRGKSLNVLFDGLVKDGLRFFEGQPDQEAIPAGYHLACVLVDYDKKGMMHDYHFVRYDRDGGCSHKMGHYDVSREDFKRTIIVDPSQPELFGSYKYEGNFLVPSSLSRPRPGI